MNTRDIADLVAVLDDVVNRKVGCQVHGINVYIGVGLYEGKMLVLSRDNLQTHGIKVVCNRNKPNEWSYQS